MTCYPECYCAAVDLFTPGMTFRVYLSLNETDSIQDRAHRTLVFRINEHRGTIMLELEFQTVSQEYAEQNFEAVAAMAENAPVLIQSKDGRDLLMFSWSDYLAHFGKLYTEEEIKELEEACRAYQEESHDHP